MKKIIIIIILLCVAIPATAQDISIFFLKDGSVIQGNVVNENQHRIFLKTAQGTIKILPKNILGREDLAKQGDLTFMADRLDYIQSHMNQMTGKVNHWNDSLNIAFEELYELFKNLEVLQNEFEIDLLRLHSRGREQKKQIEYVQDDLVNQRVDIAVNRQNMGSIDDTVTTLNKQLNRVKQKSDVTANQSYLISGTVSNLNTDLQKAKDGHKSQQNQIDIMSGSLANLIQEVQKVQNSFASVEVGIETNKNTILELTGNLKIQTDELASGMETMLEDLNRQIKTIKLNMEDQDNNSLRARKKIVTDLGDIADNFTKLKSKVSKLGNDIGSIETNIGSINKNIKTIKSNANALDKRVVENSTKK